MPYLKKQIKSHTSSKIYGECGDFVIQITDAIVEINGNRFPCLIEFLSEVPVKIETPTIEIKVPKKVVITKKQIININPKLF